MFTLKVSGDLGKKFAIASNSLDNLAEALQQFSKYKRDNVKAIFASEGPGWPGLARSTDKKLTHSFTGKITVDGKIRKSSQKKILTQIESGIKKGKIPLSARSLFKKIASGNLSDDKLALQVFGHFEQKKKAKDMNSVEKLQKKLQKLAGQTKAQRQQGLGKSRAIAKHKMLGSISNSIKAKVLGKQTLEVYSIIPWAGIHNDGGAAGKGSRIPERRFLDLTEQDLEMLATLLEGHVTKNL
jgi:phage gpG-like protein